VALACAQNGLHLSLEGIQLLQRHKGLHGAGKAAAVNADSARAVQEMLCGGNGHSHFLMLFVPGRDDVLQVFPAAGAGFVDQLQEGLKITGAQGVYLPGNALVVGVDVESPEHSPVTALFAACGQICNKGLKGHIPQDLAAADSGHGAALVGDGGVLIGQVGVVCTGIQDAEGKACLREIHLHRLHIGVGRIGKVDGDNVAHAGGHLIHQAAGLAKVDVLCPLADLRNGDGGDLFGHEAVVQDDTDQHLKGGRGRNTAALGHVGGDIHVQAGEGSATLLEGLTLAPQQGHGGVLFLLAGSKVAKVDDTEVIALALHTQLVQAVGGSGSDHVNVHAAGQHPAMLVVGVIAADLGAARGAVQSGLGVGTKGRFQPVQHCRIACGVGSGLLRRTAVEGGQPGGMGAARQLLLPDRNRLHHGAFLLV